MNEKSKVDRNMLLEQYKICIEMADRISQRRQSANSYFLTINTALISLLIAFFAYSIYMGTGYSSLIAMIAISISILGAVNCYTWYRLIRSENGSLKSPLVLPHHSG